MFLLTLLYVAALLLGSAEVLRDNAAQTLLPSIVPKDRLETANGQMWGAELVTNSFIGPPLAGALLGVAFALPFFVESATFAVAAALVFSLAGQFAPKGQTTSGRIAWRAEMKEGFGWLWHHPLLRPMAIILGGLNAMSALALSTYVLFVQDVLGLSAESFGLLLTGAAAGGVVGSVLAPRVSRVLGSGTSLFVSLLGIGVCLAVTGLTSSAVVVWLMVVIESFLAVVWNVITVSLRQTIIPDHLLGRVNSVYRFFGWGMIPIGSLLGGLTVLLAEAVAGREWGLRWPFLIAAAVHLLVFLYALPKLNTANIERARAEAAPEPAAVTSATSR
ncbi:MAG: MFS transporter [Jiangellaceae bacterium]